MVASSGLLRRPSALMAAPVGVLPQMRNAWRAGGGSVTEICADDVAVAARASEAVTEMSKEPTEVP